MSRAVLIRVLSTADLLILGLGERTSAAEADTNGAAIDVPSQDSQLAPGHVDHLGASIGGEEDPLCQRDQVGAAIGGPP